MKAKSISDIKSSPFFAQFTTEQIANQLAKNAAALREMHKKAIAKGGKYNHYTADELAESALYYESLSKTN